MGDFQPRLRLSKRGPPLITSPSPRPELAKAEVTARRTRLAETTENNLNFIIIGIGMAYLGTNSKRPKMPSLCLPGTTERRDVNCC